MANVIDLKDEEKRIIDQMEKIRIEINKISKMLENSNFIKNAPDEVVKKQNGVLFGKREDTKWKDAGEWKWFENDDDDRTGRYKGEIVNGKPNGQGTFINIEGHKYVGEWKDGLPNGQGTSISSDGSRYEGKYKDGKFHGQGTKTWSDGMYVGKYRDGKLSTGIFYDKNRNNSFKIVNGRKIKQ